MKEYVPEPQVSPWAVSGVLFAAIMLVLVGIFQAINGLSAILDDSFYTKVEGYEFNMDVTTWGWIHLILGIFIFLTGLSLFSGKTWATAVAIVIAMVSAIDNFFFIPYYPFWSIIMIALDVFIIWSLAKVASVEG